MSYETKVLLISLAKIISSAKNLEEVYQVVVDMADADGVKIKSFSEAKQLLKDLDNKSV